MNSKDRALDHPQGCLFGVAPYLLVGVTNDLESGPHAGLQLIVKLSLVLLWGFGLGKRVHHVENCRCGLVAVYLERLQVDEEIGSETGLAEEIRAFVGFQFIEGLGNGFEAELPESRV